MVQSQIQSLKYEQTLTVSKVEKIIFWIKIFNLFLFSRKRLKK
jgi:hypothetical protein